MGVCVWDTDVHEREYMFVYMSGGVRMCTCAFLHITAHVRIDLLVCYFHIGHTDIVIASLWTLCLLLVIQVFITTPVHNFTVLINLRKDTSYLMFVGIAT